MRDYPNYLYLEKKVELPSGEVLSLNPAFTLAHIKRTIGVTHKCLLVYKKVEVVDEFDKIYVKTRILREQVTKVQFKIIETYRLTSRGMSHV